jgi:insertion element IS1 protein InsB
VALRRKKTQKLWIWEAYCRTTGHLIDWECGHRDGATLQKLLLKSWKVKIYYTDRWESYRELIPSEMLVPTKKETVSIERNHGRQRHWIGRFRRCSIIVSKSIKMVDLTLALFAALLNIFQKITQFRELPHKERHHERGMG